MAEKSIEQTRLFASMVAKKQSWVLNPDEDFTGMLVEGLAVNWNRYGYFLCPCRDSEGSKEADGRVICPCIYSWDDVRDFGHCYCALYLSESFAASKTPPKSIPDRRFSN